LLLLLLLQEGDQLIAVDHFNTSEVPAKVTQRMMGTLSWPRVLVFRTRYGVPLSCCLPSIQPLIPSL
jgi:hypothetical protein